MITLKQLATSVIAAAMLFTFLGCTRHEIEVKPIEIKPIHITIDVNVKIDKELDDFFGDIYDAQAEEAAKTKK